MPRGLSAGWATSTARSWTEWWKRPSRGRNRTNRNRNVDAQLPAAANQQPEDRFQREDERRPQPDAAAEQTVIAAGPTGLDGYRGGVQQRLLGRRQCDHRRRHQGG